jgi:hypothetical protein
MAYETKTKPTTVSAASYIDAIGSDERRKDCKAIAALMKRVTGKAPKMWGPSIVGFDQYHYRYASGHEGDMCIVGFADRKADIALYVLGGDGYEEVRKLLPKLGRHRAGKACLYVKRLADIDMSVLEAMVTASVAETRRRYPATGG